MVLADMVTTRDVTASKNVRPKATAKQTTDFPPNVKIGK